MFPGDRALTSRLDEEKLETLRKWGAGLGEDPRDEVRAAGRAILLLIAEVEQLHIDAWNARAGAGASAGEAPGGAGESDELDNSLRRRLGLRRAFPSTD